MRAIVGLGNWSTSSKSFFPARIVSCRTERSKRERTILPSRFCAAGSRVPTAAQVHPRAEELSGASDDEGVDVGVVGEGGEVGEEEGLEGWCD